MDTIYSIQVTLKETGGTKTYPYAHIKRFVGTEDEAIAQAMVFTGVVYQTVLPNADVTHG